MIQQPNCDKRKCRFYLGINRINPMKESTEFPYCAAYIDGIPYEIAYGDNKHFTVRPDQDNDIVFEKDPDSE